MHKAIHGLLAGVGVAMLSLSAPAEAQTAPAAAKVAATPPTLSDLASRFGARQFIHGMTISPDGRHIAVLENMPAGFEVLATADLNADGPPKSIMRSPGGDAHLTHCFWPTDSRLICDIFYMQDDGRHILGYTRLITLNADGSDVKMLTVNTNFRSLYHMQYGGDVIDQAGGSTPGTVLMSRYFVPENTLGTRLAHQEEGLGVEKVDVVSLQRQTIEQPRKDSAGFITDGLGQLRLRADVAQDVNGYEKDYIDWFYRKQGEAEWRPLSRVTDPTGSTAGFQPLLVDPKLDVVYGLDAKDGMNALYRIKLDGSMSKDLVLARSDVDIDGVLTIGRQRRVVGAAYATDRRQVEYFDKNLKALGTALDAALPGHPEIGFIDASADESQLLLLATSDTNPGMFYRFDKANRHLQELLPIRPELQGIALATMKPITFTTRDGSQVPAYLTLPVGSTGKGLPAIVMPHGGPSARDEWGFDWLAQFFAARGFAVLQPNFRGSSGYGATWFQKNGFQSWKSAINDIDDAGKWLVSAGIADPTKMAIVGWSYGGYAALQSGVYEPGLYKAIVAIAPVTDLPDLVTSTTDFSDHEIVTEMIGTGPQLQEGSPAHNARKIAVPVLMFQGTWDQNVPISQSRTMLARLHDAGKTADLVEFPHLDHQLDDAGARTTMLTRIDDFLRWSMGMTP